MPASIAIRGDFTASELRKLAARAKDANQGRRLLALAAVYDGMSRAEAAKIGGMDRQTLRDWVHRFNAEGVDGLKDRQRTGRKPLLDGEQRAKLDELVDTPPDPVKDGVVRWRCLDLKTLIRRRFGVDYHVDHIGRLLHALGWSPQKPERRARERDEEAIRSWIKTVWPRVK